MICVCKVTLTIFISIYCIMFALISFINVNPVKGKKQLWYFLCKNIIFINNYTLYGAPDYWFIMISLKKVFNQLFKNTLFWIYKSVIRYSLHFLIKCILLLSDWSRVKIFIMLQNIYYFVGSYITLQPKTGCPLKLNRVEPGQCLDGRHPGKTRLLLEEVLVRPAGGAHPAVCVGPNAPV